MMNAAALARRKLGNSDLDITLVGLGAWAIGGDWAVGWGPQDDNDSIATIKHAVESGVNWIDTAAIYGLGHSEAVVGRAVREIDAGKRPYIFTKCGQIGRGSEPPVENLEPASIRRECDASLRRLGVDAIDLYQIHWPSDRIEDIDGAWETMASLQREGKVRYIGVSNFDVAELERARAIAPVTSLQPPYSLLRREIEAEILPYCKANGIGVIVYSPMGSGLLSGTMTRERALSLPPNDWRSRKADFQEPKLSRNLELVALLREIGSRDGKSPGEVAIAWTLANPAVTAAIVGARTPEQVDGWIGAAAYTLQAGDLERIATFLKR
jgi:aryl-alcohol dehydrogenase-like predicted oxidoreductase